MQAVARFFPVRLLGAVTHVEGLRVRRLAVDGALAHLGIALSVWHITKMV